MWSLTFRVPAAAAAAFSGLLENLSLSLSAFEVLDDDGRQIGDAWQIDALFAEEPDRAEITAQMSLMAASAGVPVPDFSLAPLPDTDWVAANLSSFAPLSIGRFWVHGGHETGPTPSSALPLRVDAATAFGTGEHATTCGCLLALEALAKRTALRRAMARSGAVPALDVGCGTGILALAAAKLWPGRVLASDIDPEAVRVARATVQANGMTPRIRVVAAAGLRSRAITRSAPYAVITANILARPLCRLAPDLAGVLAEGGRLILSGLLATQVPMVRNAYRAQHLVLERTFIIGEWATLVLRRAPSSVASSPPGP